MRCNSIAYLQIGSPVPSPITKSSLNSISRLWQLHCCTEAHQSGLEVKRDNMNCSAQGRVRIMPEPAHHGHLPGKGRVCLDRTKHNIWNRYHYMADQWYMCRDRVKEDNLTSSLKAFENKLGHKLHGEQFLWPFRQHSPIPQGTHLVMDLH